MSDFSDEDSSDRNDRLTRVLTADEFLNRIALREHSQLTLKNSIFFIGVREYNRAWKILADSTHSLHGYAYDKLRYDYDSVTQQLQIMSISSEHEFFLQQIAGEIYTRLTSVETELQKTFASNIVALRSTSFDYVQSKYHCHEPEQFETSDANSTRILRPRNPATLNAKVSFDTTSTSEVDEVVRHLQPDDQWRFKGVEASSVVIEIAKSQSYPSLEGKARRFITDSAGGISVVIGFMLNSKGRGKEKLHKGCSVMIVWIAVRDPSGSVVAKRSREEVFRHSDGTVGSRRGLNLMLSAFASSHILKEYSTEHYQILSATSIYISLHEMNQALTEAQAIGNVNHSPYSSANVKDIKNDLEKQRELI